METLMFDSGTPDDDTQPALLDVASLDDAVDEENAVLDEAAFFQTSQLIDSLRDVAKSMLRNPPSGTRVTDEMVVRYNQLRDRSRALVESKYTAQIDEFIPVLQDGSDVHSIVFASSQLARWIDSVHLTPMHLLAQQVREVSAGDTRNQLRERTGTSQDVPRPPAVGGNYL